MKTLINLMFVLIVMMFCNTSQANIKQNKAYIDIDLLIRNYNNEKINSLSNIKTNKEKEAKYNHKTHIYISKNNDCNNLTDYEVFINNYKTTRCKNKKIIYYTESYFLRKIRI